MKTRREFLQKTTAGGIAGIIASGVTPAYAKYTNREKSIVSLEQAQKVHDKCLIIDGHNDMPVERVARGERKFQWKRRDLAYHTDIPRMKEGGYDVGFFIVGNGLIANVWVTTELTLSDIEAYPEDLMLVLSSKDAVRARELGKIGVIVSIEGPAKWLQGEIVILRLLYRLGLRLMHITHGEGGSEPQFMQGTRSPSGYCTAADREAERKNAGGLTPLGLELLKESNELGIVTDLSHSNDKTFYEVMERSSKPPIVSHTAVFSCCQNWRCLTDDQIRALADAGGVMGILFYPGYIDQENPTLDRMVEHICYAADLVGIEHVGIGTDFDGMGRTIKPLVPDVSQLVLLTQSMLAHGLSEEEIQKVWGGNFLRILQQNID